MTLAPDSTSLPSFSRLLSQQGLGWAKRLGAVAVALAVLGGATSPASAGVLNPAHRVERIGQGVPDVAAVLTVPQLGRLLVLQRNGDIRLIAGDGAVNTLLTHLNASQACSTDGVLSAAWDSRFPGSVFYVTFVQSGSRKMGVAKVTLSGQSVASTQVIYTVNAATACTNVGGGIAHGADGKLYVGVGDLGNSASAASASVVGGEILRMNTDGTRPSDNPFPGFVFSQGVRNPARITFDATAGRVYFLDVGDGTFDELNLLGDLSNYGWPTGMGPLEAPGVFVDPVHSWPGVSNVSGLGAYRGSNLGPAYQGDLIVSSANGLLTRIDLDDTGVYVGEVRLATPGSGVPTAFRDLTVLPDGYVYLPDGDTSLHRFLAHGADPAEPSALTSIVPMIPRKSNDGTRVEISVEREAGVIDYGLYTGDLNVLRDVPTGNWTHPLDATTFLAADTNTANAYSRAVVPLDALGQTGENRYFILSARNGRMQTGVGETSAGAERPGGNLTYGCPCPAGIAEGTRLDECREPWTLAQGMHGVGNPIGPVTFDETWDCNVILMDLSEGWCYWCHVLAPDLDALYEDYRDNNFTLITLMSEGYDGRSDIANFGDVEQWTADPCYPVSTCAPSLNPVILDENRRVMNRYFNASGTCNGWPQSIVFDADGVQTDVICGADPDAARAAVERNLRAAGYIP